MTKTRTAKREKGVGGSEQEISIESLVYQALGEASMCWSETPTGIFDSSKVKEIGDKLIEKTKRMHHLETLIRGHMEAMRPLLDEWSKID